MQIWSFINTGELIEHNFENKTVLDFEPLNKSQLISIKVGIDQNADSKFDRDSEPQEIFIMNVKTRAVENLVSNEVKEDIQRMMDN